MPNKEYREPGSFISSNADVKKLAAVLKKNGVAVFEYLLKEDRLIVYDEELKIEREISGYLAYLEKNTKIHPEDRWKAIAFYQGRFREPVEVRVMEEDGRVKRVVISAVLMKDEEDGSDYLLCSSKNVTEDKVREELLEDQARKDPLTGLYNRFAGKELIDDYLNNKNPYASCGLMVIDIDYFKNVNDSYGHLFGDTVLKELSQLLRLIFDKKDILMRAGGDEFVVLVKDIGHQALVKKAMQLVKAVRRLTFPETGYSMTCSVGVCFLPENVSGYNYEQLFENADWALYRAKENGRNRYIFCDNLQRFEFAFPEEGRYHADLDARYFHNDIVSTAFEIFEKMNSFDAAVDCLLEVIGIRLGLDRITIIRTDIKEKNTRRQYQWRSPRAPEALAGKGSFKKEDFLTLFHSYDEYGTTVLHYDDLGMYSKEAAELLMQGEAKTVVYAAMYCEGRYTGAISYVVCGQKRFWSKQNRRQLGEVTKIISAHLAKNQAMNASWQGTLSAPGYDSLTGLLAFPRFREEVERIIVGGYAENHVIVYSDFEDFKYFNRKYGYAEGDMLLREFSNYIISIMEDTQEAYFTRVIADQFVLFRPYPQERLEEAEERVAAVNREFIRQMSQRFPESRLRIRSGIYPISTECTSVSEAIDAANYARRQISDTEELSVKLYDEGLARRQMLEDEIINGTDDALQKHQFQIYLQPRISMENFQVIGAEALVRWQRKDGSVVGPSKFISVYEGNGRIVDLDFFVFEQVAAFLAKNNRLGRRQLPVSVNASILHAKKADTMERYLGILEKYGVDASLLEIELTETATVSNYEKVKCLFELFRKAGFRTAMDDFGAGYSVLNTIVDIPVDTVKLDREVLLNCEAGERGIYFLNQIIAMVKGLGYHVVCEGVETEKQVEILKNAGCQEMQGYYFARPMTIEEYEKLVYQ